MRWSAMGRFAANFSLTILRTRAYVTRDNLLFSPDGATRPATCRVSLGCAPEVPCTSELCARVIASSVVPASLRTLQASALLCRSPLPRAAHRRVEPVRQIASKRGYAHALRYPGPFQ